MANPAGPDLKGQFPVTRAEKWRDAEILRSLRFTFDSGFILCVFRRSCIFKQPLLSCTNYVGSFSHRADDGGAASVTAVPHRALSFRWLPCQSSSVVFLF